MSLDILKLKWRLFSKQFLYSPNTDGHYLMSDAEKKRYFAEETYKIDEELGDLCMTLVNEYAETNDRSNVIKYQNKAKEFYDSSKDKKTLLGIIDSDIA